MSKYNPKLLQEYAYDIYLKLTMQNINERTIRII